MTLAAAKKLIFKLPLKKRLELAGALVNSASSMRKPVTLAELEARIDEVESGKVKLIPGDKVLADLKKLIESKIHKRSRQRGRRPGPATSRT